MNSSFARPVDRRFLLAIGLLALLAMVAVAMLAAPARSQAAGNSKVSVMTRNVYLGADLSPGIAAQNFNELKDAAGTILNQVDQNNFPVRAKGLAKEILQKRPASWACRRPPCGGPRHARSPFIPPQATTVRYDYIQLLLDQLKRAQLPGSWSASRNSTSSRRPIPITARITAATDQRAADHARRDPRPRGADVVTRNPGKVTSTPCCGSRSRASRWT